MKNLSRPNGPQQTADRNFKKKLIILSNLTSMTVGYLQMIQNYFGGQDHRWTEGQYADLIL